jgi:hypothetical protein
MSWVMRTFFWTVSILLVTFAAIVIILKVLGPERYMRISRGRMRNLYRITKLMDEFMGRHHIKYALIWGSLLGAVRNQPGGPMFWDDDVDVAIRAEDSRKLLDAMQGDAEFNRCIQWKHQSFGYQFKLRATRGYYYDIFVYDWNVSEQKYLTKNVKEGGAIFTWDEVFPTTSTHFGDLQLPCPREAEKLLRRWYGNDVFTHATLCNHLLHARIGHWLDPKTVDLRLLENERFKRSAEDFRGS